MTHAALCAFLASSAFAAGEHDMHHQTTAAMDHSMHEDMGHGDMHHVQSCMSGMVSADVQVGTYNTVNGETPISLSLTHMGQTLGSGDIEMSHERLVHVMAVSESKWFSHAPELHPFEADGRWHATVPGHFAGDHSLIIGGRISHGGKPCDFQVVAEVALEGPKQLETAEAGGTWSDGRFEVVPHHHEIRISLFDEPFKLPALMGAPAHVLLQTEDGQFVHLHPMQKKDGVLSLGEIERGTLYVHFRNPSGGEHYAVIDTGNRHAMMTE